MLPVARYPRDLPRNAAPLACFFGGWVGEYSSDSCDATQNIVDAEKLHIQKLLGESIIRSITYYLLICP